MKKFFTQKQMSAVFISGVLFSFHVALTTYINSTVLSAHTNTPGLWYSVSSVLAIILLFSFSRPLNNFGARQVALALTLICLLSLYGLANIESTFGVLMLFIIYLASNTLIYYTLDIFLEHYSKDESTGGIRGSYLSTISIAWVLAPVLAGSIIGTQTHSLVYQLGIILIAPVFFIIFYAFKNFKDTVYVEEPIKKTISGVLSNKNVRKIYLTNFLLQFFYACMTIFMPIYLHEHIGFSWMTIGLIFTIMLLPFVILERPLGNLADKKWGEKEMLSLGFMIIGISTIILSMMSTTNPLIWALILFITRIGAATIEVMNDSYFFKHVDSKDVAQIGFFRSNVPLAYIIAPVLATGALFFVSYNTIFAGLGFIMLLGLFASTRIQDTK